MSHIVYVCEDRGIGVDGTKGSSVHVRSMARALALAAGRLTLLSPRIGEADWAAGLPIDLVPLDKSDAASLATALDTIQQSQPIDAVYERLSLFANRASRWTRENKIPHWIEVNAPLCEEALKHRGLKNFEEAQSIERKVLLGADMLLPVSPWLALWLRRLDCDETKIRLLSNGVDKSWLVAGGDTQEVSAPSRLTRVGFVGSLRPWHDLQCLVETAKQSDAGEFEFTIVGDGPQRRWLEHQLESDELSQRLDFKGSVPTADIPSALDRFDICVAPYAQLDPFYFCPVKIYEYGARRRPVVAAGLDELKKQFPAGTMAYYEPGDPQDLLQTLRSIKLDPEAGRALASRLHAHVCDHTWDQQASRVLEMGGVSPIAPGESEITP